MSELRLIQDLFDELTGLPPAEREASLERITLSTECRNRLLGLLQAHDHAGGFLESSAAAFLPSIDFKQPVLPSCFERGALISDRFEIRRYIGAGGMGEVYEAWDLEMRCKVALKTVLLSHLADERSHFRLRREAAMARQISHENVCRVNEVFRHKLDGGGEMTVLAMEYIEGPTLSEYMSRRGALPEAEVLRFGAQLAAALEAAHGRGVVHRDLKPANVLVELADDAMRTARRVVVTDFGIASGDSEFKSTTRTRNQLIGTPQYMAPELWRGGEAPPRSDIYSLGVILYELASGERMASEAAGLGGVIRQSLVTERPKAAQIPAKIGRRLQSVILKCIEPDPEARYASASEVRQALEAPLVADPARRAVGRRTWIAGAAAAAFAGGMALMNWPSGRLKRLVVLPVQNETHNEDLDYVCRGATSELLREASRLDRMRVIPYYGAPPAVLRGLGGEYALKGTMADAGQGPTLLVQVLDTQDGSVIWTRSFNRSRYASLLHMQDDVSRAVSIELEELAAKGGGTGLFQVSRKLHAAGAPVTSNPEAFECFLRGKNLLAERRLEAALDAEKLFVRATELDRNFALAFAALADAQTALMDHGYAPMPELLKRGTQYAERAVREGPLLAETHTSLAGFRQMSWDWEGAESSFREALRLQPSHARAIRHYAGLKAQFEITDSVLDQLRKAAELEPYDASIKMGLNMCLFFAGRYDEAIAAIEELARVKNNPGARHNLGNVYAWLGKTSSGSQAVRFFAQALEQAAAVEQSEKRAAEKNTGMHQLGMWTADRMYSLYYSLAGRANEAEPYIQKLTIEVNSGKTSPVMLARAHAALGNPEEAMHLLEVAFVRKDRGMMYIKMNPFLRALHSQPRFQELVRTMRLS